MSSSDGSYTCHMASLAEIQHKQRHHEARKTGYKYLGMLFANATNIDGYGNVIHFVWLATQVHPLVIYDWDEISLHADKRTHTQCAMICYACSS